MKIMNLLGTGCAADVGSFAVPGSILLDRRTWQMATARTASDLRHAAVGESVYRLRFHSLITLNGIAMPATHRMRVSASEP